MSRFSTTPTCDRHRHRAMAYDALAQRCVVKTSTEELKTKRTKNFSEESVLFRSPWSRSVLEEERDYTVGRICRRVCSVVTVRQITTCFTSITSISQCRYCISTHCRLKTPTTSSSENIALRAEDPGLFSSVAEYVNCKPASPIAQMVRVCQLAVWGVFIAVF